MNVGNYGRLTVWYFDGDNQYAANVINLVCDQKLGTGATQVQIISAFAALFDPLIAPCLAVPASVYGMTFEQYGAGAPDITEILDGTAGTSGATLCPPQVSGLIKLHTGLAGRAFRGRKYVPFMSTDDVDTDGGPTGAYEANLALLAPMFTGGFSAGAGANTNHFSPVIYHKSTGTGTVITDAQVAGRFATMRRRSAENRADTAPF